jgi:excisionase family DNA binding protein
VTNHTTRNGRRIKSLVEHTAPYVTTSELADYWMVSRKQIYKQIEAGTLKAIRLGPRLLRISKAAAVEFEELAKMIPPDDALAAVRRNHSADREAGTPDRTARSQMDGPPHSPRKGNGREGGTAHDGRRDAVAGMAAPPTAAPRPPAATTKKHLRTRR